MLRLPWAREATWAFVKQEWHTLTTKLGVFQGLPSVVDGLDGLCTTAQAEDVRQFFAKNRVAAVERGVRQSIAAIESCALVDARQSPALGAWLAKVAG